jgi:hypothetical protein
MLEDVLRRSCQIGGTFSTLLLLASWDAAQVAWSIFFYVCAVLLFHGAMILGEEAHP